MARTFLYIIFCLLFVAPPRIANATPDHLAAIQPAAHLFKGYLPLLKGKRVALLINQTATVGSTLLLDTLLSQGVNVVKIFVPEHGFRGSADAGTHIKNDKDVKTGLPIISLYGNNKKPKATQLADVDVVVYDLQDVGARFYTYISTLQYAMEACAAAGKEIIVLDRPNPNGHYVDGPVLDTALRSFVGMQPIPIVYGMTAGEYAKMLVGERWFPGAAKTKLTVIECKGYDHTKRYDLPVSPSPNLKNMAAIYLYPSMCLFEGTVISLGRGTDMPFQQWGHPDLEGMWFTHTFTPVSMTGATAPPLQNKRCYGELIATEANAAYAFMNGRLPLTWLLKAYAAYPDKKTFFIPFFHTLAGTKTLRKQIEQGMTEAEIRTTWQPGLAAFKKIRKKYLLYKDFE